MAILSNIKRVIKQEMDNSNKSDNWFYWTEQDYNIYILTSVSL